MPTNSSAPIAWPLANQLAEAYEVHPNCLKVFNAAIQPTPLKGFRISAAHMLNLIQGKNNSGAVVQSPAQDIYLMFGVKEADLSKPLNEQGFTAMFFGVDSQNNLLKNSIYDYCMPCPDMCPNK